MKRLIGVVLMIFSVSCQKAEFKPTYSAPAFEYLDQVKKAPFNKEISDGDILDLNEGWQFYGWDTTPGKDQDFPDFPEGKQVKIPHRITQPNSNIWYSGSFLLSEGFLKINGDDGAQLWSDGQRIYQNEDQLYSIGENLEQEIKLKIRVINNAVSGGLKEVSWTSRESWEKLTRRKKSAFDSAVNEAKKSLWLSSDYPTDWKEYPMYFSEPVLLPNAGKDSIIIRWVGEKSSKAQVHFGIEPSLILLSVNALEEDGIYTAVVPRHKCQFYFFEMDKTQSPLFSLPKPNTKKEISFAVWADSQGGWETFSQIIDQMKTNKPDFSISIGDLVGNGSESWQYVRLLDLLSRIAVPHHLFAGNHDYDGSYDDWTPRHFNRFLRTKNQKPYEYWQEGPCSFIALDPNANFPVSVPDTSTQFKWFNKIIRSEGWKSAAWKIILVHQPPFSQGWMDYHGEYNIHKLLQPYWESGLIDMVISGHTHDYERLILHHEKGKTAFVIVGGAGGGLEPDETMESYPKMDKVIRIHHLGWIDAGEESLEFNAVDLDGKIIDGFTLVK